MFAEKFDSLMNIAEISNSRLGREVNINPSYIGRLRSGARPLPKKHEYLTEICRYLAEHIRKEYQVNALQQLTGIETSTLASPKDMALHLELWLLEQEKDAATAAGRLISGFSSVSSKPVQITTKPEPQNVPQMYAAYLYGNAGKRKAVEQFFSMILQEEKPQTLLLFSDENMAWLYEDSAFAARWAELFAKVIMKGNRVKIIHTLSRDLNEMIEAVTKWIPIYMTGMIEPYYYPRLRDGVFQRTLFLAPNTAGIVSSSVQQDTNGMLNLFITDRSALDALTVEYEHYFSLCRPLMRIFTERDSEAFQRNAESLAVAEANAYLCCAIPPFFTMPEKLVRELSKKIGNESLFTQWNHYFNLFQSNIKKQHLTLVLLNPESALLSPDSLRPAMGSPLSDGDFLYTKEQYGLHIEYLQKLEKQYANLTIRFISQPAENTLLYIKENTGVLVANQNKPNTAFLMNDRNMVSAFWDYMEKRALS